jgi:hypothetical protein
MDKKPSYLETQAVIDEAIKASLKEKGYPYTCGLLGGVLTQISICSPEAREEIVRAFNLFVSSEAKTQNK